ncbi:AraC-like ligand-binding domain-containing protein [Paraburkholderia tropica]|uniref:AraC-like ligand-binding domain-containing protein n=1 Tax=Paraburkholderia tropica TaxID=92647 RepID=UPI002AB7617F|nr:helix-turn-helix domain-containing protein [Paraburkholderia tropica]
MTTHFSTSTVEAPVRLEYWRDVICRTYVSVNCAPLDMALDAHVSVHALGCAQLSDISSSAMTYARTAESIRQAPSDDLQLCLIQGGSVAIAQSDREVLLGSGDIALYDAARPFSLHFAEQYRSLILKFPRPMLAARIPDIDRLMALKLSGDSKLGLLVNSVIRESVRFGEPGDELIAAQLSGSVADIVCVAIENELSERRRGDLRQLGQIERIKRFMINHLGDASLDIALIASECHIAPRTIHRLFASEGTTAIRWLWQQRLSTSYRLLAEGRVKQVSEAAINCGFSDFSHFTRAFKKAFGIVPHSLLRRLH